MHNGSAGARASISRCTGYQPSSAYRSIKEALDRLGGIASFVAPGSRVLLKPNFLIGRPPERCVNIHPAVVRAVAELVLEAGGTPVIGDSPQLGSAMKVAEKCGVASVAREDSLVHNYFDPDGRMQAIEYSIAVYQRNFAQGVTHGERITWLENDVFVEDPRILADARRWIKRFQELGIWALQLDRKLSAQVAVFLDDESFWYESIHNNLDIPLIWQQRVINLNRFGAPHDVYLLNDLLEEDLPPYKLYIFLNPFHLNKERRAKLKSILHRDNKVALWLYAPGYINSDAADGLPIHTDHMTDLTGFHFGKGLGHWGPFMNITNFNHPFTRGLPQDFFWGTTNPIGPNNASGRCRRTSAPRRRSRSWHRC